MTLRHRLHRATIYMVFAMSVAMLMGMFVTIVCFIRFSSFGAWVVGILFVVVLLLVWRAGVHAEKVDEYLRSQKQG